MKNFHKKEIFFTLKYFLIAIFSGFLLWGVSSLEQKFFPFYTNYSGSYPSFWMYFTAFVKIFFFGILLFSIGKFFHKKVAHIKIFRFLNYFYFSSIFSVFVFLYLYVAGIFAWKNIFWFVDFSENFWKFGEIFVNFIFITGILYFLIIFCLMIFARFFKK